MIGSKSIEINADNFLKGMSSSDYMNDGGFSNISQAANIYKTPGLLYGVPPITDETDDLTDELIANCEDPRVYTTGAAPYDKIFSRLFVDNAGNYYGWDSSGGLDLIETDGTNPTKYADSKTYMMGFGQNTVYVTNAVGIVEWTISTGTLSESFYTFTGSYAAVVPHPCIVYENNAYYANGNVLLRQTSVGGTPAEILTLPAEQVIVALSVDPGSGKMLISIVDGLNASGTEYRIARVGYYDGFSNKLSKVVRVDNMITAFKPCGGTLYVCYGNKFGYWTGSGIVFLRKLNITLSSAGLVYDNRITNIDDTVYLIEGSKILAYGEVAGRRMKVFYYVHTELENGAELTLPMTCVVNLNNTTLGYCFINNSSVEKFKTIDLSSTSSVGTSLYWRTHKYTFPKPVMFNAVEIEYGIALPSDNSVVGVLSVRDDTQTGTLLDGGTGVQTTRSGLYQYTLTYPTIKTRSIQLSYTFSLQYPIKRITIFYNDVE